MRILAGTSGFSYKPWKGVFYPEDLPDTRMLEHYASRLPAVEINNTFYRLPKAETLERWAEQTPASFRFVIKASRRITHMKRLKEPVDETTYLLDTLGVLGERLHAVLFQLPPNLKADHERLGSFLRLIDGCVRAAFEFRHDSWHDDQTTDLLRAHGAALVAAETDEDDDPPVAEPTASWGYVRLRRSDYADDELRAWIVRLRDTGWDDCVVFFKHEDAGVGPRLAERMLELANA